MLTSYKIQINTIITFNFGEFLPGGGSQRLICITFNIKDSHDTHLHPLSKELTLFVMLPNLATVDKVTIAMLVILTLSVAL